MRRVSAPADAPAGRALHVLATGPSTTVQDLGRPGFAHLGVPTSGAADRVSAATANRLVGNQPSAAVLEVVLGGLVLRARGDVLLAVTGASAPVSVGVDESRLGATGHASAVVVRDGHRLTIGSATRGLRVYVAVRGGFDVAATLGSRSTDTLSGLGPQPVAAGDVVPVGADNGPWPSETQAFLDIGEHAESAAVRRPRPVRLRAVPGPRDDALVDAADLFRGTWRVDSASDRVGVRIDRDTPDPPLTVLPHQSQVPSEGVALGSVQVPPSGRPVIFLADHPVTGGYPVVAVLTAESVSRTAQLAPGALLEFVR